MGSNDSHTPHPEHDRIRALHDMQILETPIEQRFEQITELLQSVFQVPISALSFVDRHRQWFKSIQGLRVEQTLRSVAFCQHTVKLNRTMVIPDARFDDVFGNNELVTGDPGIVFYAGTPVHAPDGSAIASLCVIGFEPRSLDRREIQILEQMAALTEIMLQSPRVSETEDTLLHHVGESWRTTMIDPLTRVWNADGIKTVIQESVNQSKQKGQRVGVAMFELAGLDEYAREHGLPACDELLFRFTRRALKAMKPSDSIGRLRAGEFAMVLSNIADKDDLYDRTAILQMVADDLTPSCDTLPASLCGRIAGVLLHPQHQVGAAQAMEYVEEILSHRHAQGSAIPLIGESTDSINAPFEKHQPAA
ncbi:MAG: GAF domain-containing protein [Phycisphaerales bacterium]